MYSGILYVATGEKCLSESIINALASRPFIGNYCCSVVANNTSKAMLQEL